MNLKKTLANIGIHSPGDLFTLFACFFVLTLSTLIMFTFYKAFGIKDTIIFLVGWLLCFLIPCLLKKWSDLRKKIKIEKIRREREENIKIEVLIEVLKKEKDAEEKRKSKEKIENQENKIKLLRLPINAFDKLEI